MYCFGDLALILGALLLHVAHCCQFPALLQARTWYRDIRPSADSRTVIYFWADIMEAQRQRPSTGDVQLITQTYCLKAMTSPASAPASSASSIEDPVLVTKHASANGGPALKTRHASANNPALKQPRKPMATEGAVLTTRYIVSSERDPRLPTAKFSCLEFVHRSDSIVQMKRSDSIDVMSLDLCDEANLHLQASLLVAIETVHLDQVNCPFSGGWNMEIIHQNNEEHICNSNDIPMRFESNCFTGDGVILDLKDRSCIGDLPMSVSQRASCVTSWQQHGYVITVLRKADSTDLWCFMYPEGRIDNAALFTDLMCPTRAYDLDSARHYKLQLTMVPQYGVCADEHRHCARLPCIEPFIHHCLKTCGKCDPNVAPTKCDFPHKIRGEWYVNGGYKVYNLTIADASIMLGGHGRFDCVTWAQAYRQASGSYTALSLFNNGCKPRYTCLKFKLLGLNSLGFAVSQSLIWPIQSKHVKSLVCASDNFQADPPPFNDTYRTYNDVFKPAVNIKSTRGPVNCALDNTYDLQFADPDGVLCRGAMFKSCEDATHLRLQTHNCSRTLTEDFSCIGQVKGKYWEKVILLQNHKNDRDTRCLFFSELNPDRILILKSAECDQYSWTFVGAGIRTPMYDMDVTAKYGQCKAVQQASKITQNKTDHITSRHFNTKQFEVDGYSANYPVTVLSVTPHGEDRFKEADYSNGGSASSQRPCIVGIHLIVLFLVFIRSVGLLLAR